MMCHSKFLVILLMAASPVFASESRTDKLMKIPYCEWKGRLAMAGATLCQEGAKPEDIPLVNAEGMTKDEISLAKRVIKEGCDKLNTKQKTFSGGEIILNSPFLVGDYVYGYCIAHDEAHPWGERL